MTSTSIYKDFKPTYLYIKQHSITGKLYFGKMSSIKHKTPESYYGSGKYWISHINKHGKSHVITLWYCLFNDKESIQNFALNFSTKQNIVESKEWLNLKFEDGLDGGLQGNVPWNIGIPHRQSTKDKISLTRIGKSSWNKGIPMSDITKLKQTQSHIGKIPSEETRIKMSNTRKDKPRGTYKQYVCPHCGLIGGGGNMKRHHFDNCKLK